MVYPNLRMLDSGTLNALRVAINAMNRYRQSDPPVAEQFHQIIKYMLDQNAPKDTSELLNAIIDELQRRIKHMTVKIIDPNAASRIMDLSDRERAVLVLIGRGMNTARISSKLGIAYRTVVAHKANIMGKLGVGSFRFLAQFAVENMDLLSKND